VLETRPDHQPVFIDDFDAWTPTLTVFTANGDNRKA
jgi:hypothetical protein